MNRRFCLVVGSAALIALLLSFTGYRLLQGQERDIPIPPPAPVASLPSVKVDPTPKSTSAKPPVKKSRGWTLDEAMARLHLQPNDPYLQYVVLQLARRENKLGETLAGLEEVLFPESEPPAGNGGGRRNQVDLFSIFTGALAVQESLQLDAMKGDVSSAEVGQFRSRAQGPMFVVGSPGDYRAVPLGAGAPVGLEATTKAMEAAMGIRQLRKPEEEPKRAVRVLESEPQPFLRDEEELPARAVSQADPLAARLEDLEKIAAINEEQRKLDQAAVEEQRKMEQKEREQRAVLEKRRKEVVPISTLGGPVVKSHPWKTMLAGKKPRLSALCRCVPEDFYFAEFRSFAQMIDILQTNDLWSKALAYQGSREARSQPIAPRLIAQLALEIGPHLESFYDKTVAEVAVTGSDLYVGEGSDVTVLFRYQSGSAFQAHMEGFLAGVEKVAPDARRVDGRYLGVRYVHLTTSDRAVHVFAANPARGLYVRSNSKAAFRRVLEAIRDKRADGKKVRRLGDTDEFAYIRTLMPRGAAEEDGFIYLSDAFIRRQVGPQVKITERRRMLCSNHLQMIGHAAMLYRTEHGKWPRSLRTLARAGCCPGEFNKGKLLCPCGGKYTLSADGTRGSCSHHGHAPCLTPCCEIPVAHVNGEEADLYKAFVQDYNQYWRTYFDPIAIRVQATPHRYRLETVVLPLIDNSIYSGMALALGGKPEPLDSLPVPRTNIFSFAVRFNKEACIKTVHSLFLDGDAESKKTENEEDREWAKLLRSLGVPAKAANSLRTRDFLEFVEKGLGNQVEVHVCDTDPLIDLNLPSLFGTLLGSLPQAAENGGDVALGGIEEFLAMAAVASLAAPGYLSFPVQDARVVDSFLKKLDPLVALVARQPLGNLGVRIEQDFYRFYSRKARHCCRGYGIRFGPVKFRIFYARIGGALYVTSKPYILEDIIAAEDARAKSPSRGKTAARDPEGHALVRVRPQNWKRVMIDQRLAWAENNREACLKNLAPIGNVGRALAMGKHKGAAGSWDERGRQAHMMADRLHGVHFFCPEGGRYQLSPDGKVCKCSIHGSLFFPRQPAHPTRDSPWAELMRDFADMTATVTFTKEGLRAVLTVERKVKKPALVAGR